MTGVAFLDLQAATRELAQPIAQAVARVVESGWYIGGPEVQAFEQAFANHVGAPNALGVANGLDALKIALLAMGVGPGDEVLVPSNTFIATWLAVSQCGAKPVPIAPNEQTYNIDANRLAARITPRTKAIIPVHLYGQPAELDAVFAIAEQHGLWVLEDAAQAHGASYRQTRVGGRVPQHGLHAVAWSFYPGKNLGALGDGGAVTTAHADLAQQISLLRNYGSQEKYIHERVGFNSRLDPIQAAVLSVKLGVLDEWNQRRAKLAHHYLNALAPLREHGLVLPHVPDWAQPVWHLFVVRTPRRNALQHALSAAGIQTLIHYPVPPHRQGAYAQIETAFAMGSEAAVGAEAWNDECQSSETMANEILSLPMGPHLSLDDAQRVVDAVTVFFKSQP